MTSDEDRMRGILASSPWLMRVLATAASSGLPDAWVGAGVLRDLVWGRDDQATEQLRRACPGVPWEAKNQAAVHTWYHAKFGGEPVAALASIADAVPPGPRRPRPPPAAVRPPGRTAGSRYAPRSAWPICWVVSGGARRVSLDVSLARLARHQPARRWPRIRVIPPS
ncbi:MAG TPA: nucleotidyltransferase family protein [Streptosporangiaceae bacterium]|jgi:hypothetical protein|nr:nucleotidyltransferase family protein [Streptosporangiaceae bacterium]